MRTTAPHVLLVCALSVTVASPSAAQVSPTQPQPGRPFARTPPSFGPPLPAPLALTPSPSLKDHFGIDLAARLLRSTDPDDRLRGLERAATLGTAEAVSLLIHAAREPARAFGPDTRALLVIVRGLAEATSQSEVRTFLKDDVLGATLHQRPATSSAEPDTPDADRDARLALARSLAAFALATSTDPKAVEAVLLSARDPGPGQAAAAEAIVAFAPERVAAIGVGPMSPALLHLAAEMGDLRALDAVRAALHATDTPTRAAALDAISEMGDARAIAEARLSFQDADPLLRAAAGRALVRLGAPDRFRAVEALIGNDDTALEGVRIAGLGADAGVARALAARVKASGEPELRALAIAALGLSEADEAAEALKELVKDPLLEGDVAAALARSPNPRSPAIIESWLRSEAWRRLGARAYTLRALTRGEETAWGRSALLVLAASTDRRDRAVGLAALVLLGKRDAVAALRDPDPAVRRAVATAAMADPRPATEAALLDLSRHEPDLLVQKVERAALVSGDPEGRVSTVLLAERATAGESDGPLCTMALAARRDPDYQAKVEAFFASTDPIVRAHAARGLGYSEDAGATGLLAHGFGFEVDTLVRRAIVLALARRTQDKGAPARQFVLKKAARLDPDRTVRDVAARALAGLPPEARAAERMEFAWLRLATAAGHSPGEIRGSTKYVGGRPQTGEVGGLLLRSDGIAVPIAFDPEGYALVPIPPGEARLLLEPRIPVYEQPRHE